MRIKAPKHILDLQGNKSLRISRKIPATNAQRHITALQTTPANLWQINASCLKANTYRNKQRPGEGPRAVVSMNSQSIPKEYWLESVLRYNEHLRPKHKVRWADTGLWRKDPH